MKADESEAVQSRPKVTKSGSKSAQCWFPAGPKLDQTKFAAAAFDIYDHLKGTAQSLKDHVSRQGITHTMLETQILSISDDVKLLRQETLLTNARIDTLIASDVQSAKMAQLEARWSQHGPKMAKDEPT